ncbi:MAG TPA: type IV pilus modification protein PilV [Steroidobacteraceae bacterium]|nr:type IV pilus modification protein PilV [Steroidobacteraceae bacterium]
MHRTKLNHRAPGRQLGVTLIEVLVTVVVISVGLLGVAALQVVSIRDNYSAYLRSQATALADDIIDRIRANRDNASAYQVTLTGTASGTTRAALDVTDWKSLLSTAFPKVNASTTANGSITVTPIGTGRFSVRVVIQWGERGSTTAPQFTTTSEV